jgi:Domain of unknown function (DUF4342)
MAGRGFFEEVTVAGNQLVDKIKELIEEGNVRRVLIKDSTGTKTLLEIPLNLGVAASAGLMLLAPLLATVGAIAAVVTQARIVIERYEETSTTTKNPEDGPQIIEIDED